jgi:hypothetical protein
MRCRKPDLPIMVESLMLPSSGPVNSANMPLAWNLRQCRLDLLPQGRLRNGQLVAVDKDNAPRKWTARAHGVCVALKVRPEDVDVVQEVAVLRQQRISEPWQPAPAALS